MDTADIVRQIGQRLKSDGQTVATAESCTGGMIAAALTDMAGSSNWFGYGIVSYSNVAKQQLLGVTSDALLEHGAVSEKVVRQMAEGVCAVSGANWGLAASGVAGPDGGSLDKPVGTVWFAIAQQGNGSVAWCSHLAGSRAAVRQQTVKHILQHLLNRLEAQSLTA